MNRMPVKTCRMTIDGLLEESCFVPDIALEDACALADDFGQNAIVYGGLTVFPVWSGLNP
jgi:hypothetical protein